MFRFLSSVLSGQIAEFQSEENVGFLRKLQYRGWYIPMHSTAHFSFIDDIIKDTFENIKVMIFSFIACKIDNALIANGLFDFKFVN